MFASVTHVLPLTTIHRRRLLPVPGRIVVRKGQKVNPTDVVAEANLAPQHIVLEVARGLGLSPEKADRYLQRKTGDRLSEGDVIAGPAGITRRVIRAPRSGKIVLAGNGQVLMEVESPPYELRAGLPGLVTEVISDRGVAIENIGALIQAAWGNDQIDYGLMNVLLHKPEDVLTANLLDVSLRGSVILAGHCGKANVLEAAAELPARGMILSSMDSALVPLAAKMRFPILLIEGFGRLPMNMAAFKLLTTNDRREVSINALMVDQFTASRPEIVIPLPADTSPPIPEEVVTFKPNQRVHIIRAPYQSQIGTLVAVRPGLQVLPNGMHAATAEVKLESGESVILPLANLEVLE
jgi:hypothetical protein